jgi:hypothetical protein
MQDIGLGEAIQLWLDGRPLDAYSMLSLPFIWWGRWGKIFSLLAGLAVVLDFVGERTLREWGTTLRDRPLRRFANWIMSKRPVFVVLIAAVLIVAWFVFAWAKPWLSPVLSTIDAYILTLRGRLTIVVFAVIAMIWGTLPGREWARVLSRAGYASVALLAIFKPEPLVILGDLTAYLFTFAFTFAAAFVATVLAGWVFGGIIYVVDLLVTRPVAWALGRERPGHPIRWSAFVIVLVGQTLDLLAS